MQPENVQAARPQTKLRPWTPYVATSIKIPAIAYISSGPGSGFECQLHGARFAVAGVID